MWTYIYEFDIKPHFYQLFRKRLNTACLIKSTQASNIYRSRKYYTPPAAERGQQTLALQQVLFHPAMSNQDFCMTPVL